MPVHITREKENKPVQLHNELLLWIALLFGSVLIVVFHMSNNCTPLLFRMMM